MLYREFAPSAPLRPYVRSFWQLEGRGCAAQDIFPDGSMEAVYHFGDPFGGQRRALLVGQMLRPARVEPQGRVEVWGIRFAPGGVSAFLGLPQSELTDRMANLEDIWPALSRAFETRGWSRIDAALRGMLRARRDDHVLHAIRALNDSPGIPLDTLARGATLSPRQFRRRVQDAAGIGPKTLCRLARFQTALRLAGTAANLAQLAADAGYADHAHMVRDFRQFAHATPTAAVCSMTGITRVFVRFSQDEGRAPGLC